MSLEVTGLKEALAALNNLEPKVSKKIVKTALKLASKDIKGSIEAEAPVGVTGDLSRSVKIKTRTKKGKITVTTQIGEGQFKGKTWYAAAVEFGTSKMEPNPFMRRAYDKVKEQVAQKAAEEIVQIVEQEANKK